MKSNLPYNVMAANSWERVPRDPITVGNFILATIGIQTTSVFVIAAVGYVATTLVTSFLLSALIDIPGISPGIQGLLVNKKDPVSPHDFVYGTVRKGGTVTYYETTGTNNKYLHQIISLAGHEVGEIGDIYINDEIVTLDVDGFVTGDKWSSKIRIKKHLGDQTTADPDLLAESSQIDSSFVGNGIAYLYVRYDYDQETFANGLPLITAVVTGKPVYDPRTGLTSSSSNAALCIRDYISSTFGLNDSSIDDVQLQVAANISDEDVALSVGGTEKRYEINGVFNASMKHADVLSKMLTGCAGTLFFGSGDWKLVPADYVAPTKNLTDNDLRGSISLETRTNLRQQFNIVQGVFNNSEQRWITTDYPPISSSVFIAEDGGEETPLDFELPVTTSPSAAQRIGKLALYKGREQMVFTAEFGMNAADVEVGEIITFTYERYGWDQKEFEVVGWNLKIDSQEKDLRVGLMLKETSEAALDWNAEEADIISNNTSLLDYTEVPTVGISVSAEAQVTNQKVSNIAVVEITSAREEAIDGVELEYKLSSESVYSSFGKVPLGFYKIRDLQTGEYDFRARAINAFGYRGQYTTSLNNEINAFIGDPSDVDSLSYEILGNTLFLSWPAITDADLSHYEIKHNSNTTGADWSNSNTLVEKVGRPSTSVVVPARAGTYLLRSYDKEGNFSVNFTTTVVSALELPALGTTDTQTEDPTFSGTKTNTIVDTSELVIDDTTAASPTGEYEFSAYVDTGSLRSARVTGFVTFSRVFDGTLLWDNLPGNFDDFPGNFDDWTNEDAGFGDVSARVYVSATPDDPAGTPTWGSYVLASGSQIQGRAFRFKLVMESTSTGFTPSVSELSATVEY